MPASGIEPTEGGIKEGRNQEEAIGQIQLIQSFLDLAPTPRAERKALPLDELTCRVVALREQFAARPK